MSRYVRLLAVKRVVALPLIALLLLATMFVLGGAGLAPTTSASSASASTPNAAVNNSLPYDAYFMEHMMDHHLAAIRMSQVCLKKAVHEDLRDLCQTMISEQQKETQQMQMLLKQWYNIRYTPHMAVPYQNLVTFLSSIKDDTFEVDQFDLWFLQNINAHHQIAINRSKECLDKATHEQLKKMCQMTITSQGQEIKEGQDWLCDWYGLCPDE